MSSRCVHDHNLDIASCPYCDRIALRARVEKLEKVREAARRVVEVAPDSSMTVSLANAVDRLGFALAGCEEVENHAKSRRT